MRSRESCDLDTVQLNKRAGGEADRLIVLLAPSVICVLLCLICLCGVSLAWFTTTMNTNAVSAVRTADYGVEVTVMNGETAMSPSAEGYTLEKNVEYTILLKATGEASTGFCKVTYVLTGDTTHTLKEIYTAQIAKGTTLSFKMKLVSGGVVTFSSQWGTCSASDYRVGGSVDWIDETVITTQAGSQVAPVQGDKSFSGNGDAAVTTGGGVMTTKPSTTESITVEPAVTTTEPQKVSAPTSDDAA